MDGLIIIVRDCFLVFLLLSFLTGCYAYNSLPTDTDIENAYFNNNSSFNALVGFCNKNPSVKWLGIKPEDIDLSSALDLEPDITSVIRAQETLLEVGSKTLMCTRDWGGEADYPLVAVTVPLYSIGISVSGVSKGIKFISRENIYVKARIESGELKSLGDDGWYIYFSD